MDSYIILITNRKITKLNYKNDMKSDKIKHMKHHFKP